jgi:fatty-acyl-CoA synthase
VPDDRWDERPPACVVLKEGPKCSLEDLRDFLSGRVAIWSMPGRWAPVEAMPKISVGRFDKKQLRAKLADRLIDVRVAGKQQRS